MKMIEYLGKHVSIMLDEMPFKSWRVEKYVDNDPENGRIYYIFREQNIEVSCDPNNKVRAIFLKSMERNEINVSLFETPIPRDRKQALEFFGTPSKSGEKSSSKILGDSGPWDRFMYQEHAVHVEYQIGTDRTHQITLMRSDIVP